jgi:hypothetical protein
MIMNRIINAVKRKCLNYLHRWQDNEECKAIADGIKGSCKKINAGNLTAEQEKEIQDFYRPLLGHEIPTDYHRYFTTRLGHYSKLYVPTSEYKTNIVGRLNIYTLKRAYTDKNMLDVMLPNATHPHMFLKNINGYYYFEGKPVTKDEAVRLCANLGRVLVKPSLDSRGSGVKIVNLQNGSDIISGEKLANMFDKYDRDFLIEEVICQHDDMAALNPTSLNTIRVLSYRNGMDVHIIYTVIRIGRKGKTIDNESAGGISARINPDGKLAKFAYGAPGDDNIEFTDSGVKLDGYEIPSFQKMIEFVKEQHLYMPWFDLIGWDIAINKEGNPVVIEFNITPDLSQSANGPAFGEYTETIIKDAMGRQNTWSRAAQDNMWMRN